MKWYGWCENLKKIHIHVIRIACNIQSRFDGLILTHHLVFRLAYKWRIVMNIKIYAFVYDEHFLSVGNQTIFQKNSMNVYTQASQMSISAYECYGNILVFNVMRLWMCACGLVLFVFSVSYSNIAVTRTNWFFSTVSLRATSYELLCNCTVCPFWSSFTLSSCCGVLTNIIHSNTATK